MLSVKSRGIAQALTARRRFRATPALISCVPTLAHCSLSAARRPFSDNRVANSGLDYLIARVAVLYGSQQNKKFVHWCISKLKSKEYTTLVADNIRSPTLVDDIAEALKTLIERDKKGIYHLAGPEQLTPFSMGVRIAEAFGLDKKYLQPMMQYRFKQKALRPKNTSLSIEKLKSEGISMSTFTEGLRKIKNEAT